MLSKMCVNTIFPNFVDEEKKESNMRGEKKFLVCNFLSHLHKILRKEKKGEDM